MSPAASASVEQALFAELQDRSARKGARGHLVGRPCRRRGWAWDGRGFGCWCLEGKDWIELGGGCWRWETRD